MHTIHTSEAACVALASKSGRVRLYDILEDVCARLLAFTGISAVTSQS